MKMDTRGKVCKHGLEDIWIIGKEGRVRMCGWTDYFIGNLTEHTIEELWHGEAAEKFRESLLDGSYRYCNAAKCPHCANKKLESQEIDYYVPEYPKTCNISYQLQCNYACKFCREHVYETKAEEAANYEKIETEIAKIMPHLDRLMTNGAGELFCSSSILKLLAESELKPGISIGIETNGSLFTPANWEKIRRIGEHELSVSVTVHSFQEQVYQYLSGTRLPLQNIIDNLHFIGELRKQNIVNKFNIATVICEMNYREMPAFVKKCLDEFEMDRIRLRFFEPYGVMDRAVEWFYDVRNPHHPYYEEFMKVMSDPVFNNEKVWRWQGKELSLQKENPYVLEHRNFLSLADLVLMDDAEHKIQEWSEKNKQPGVALYGAAKAGNAILRLLRSYGMDIRVIFDKFQCETADEGRIIVRPTLKNVNEYDFIIITQETYYSEMKEELHRLKYAGTVLRMSEFISQLSCEECHTS